MFIFSEGLQATQLTALLAHEEGVLLNTAGTVVTPNRKVTCFMLQKQPWKRKLQDARWRLSHHVAL
jgi:hypothetical protein